MEGIKAFLILLLGSLVFQKTPGEMGSTCMQEIELKITVCQHLRLDVYSMLFYLPSSIVKLGL